MIRMHVIFGDWLETIDSINDAVSHPNFDSTVHNPWFLIFSVVFCAYCLLRSYKALIACYLGGIAIWYVIANVVMKDKTSASGGSPVFMFAGAIVLIAGILIYFTLIKD